MKNLLISIVICCAMASVLIAGDTSTADNSTLLSALKSLYAAGEFDGAIAFCRGVSSVEADLVCYLCYTEKYGRSHAREDRDHATACKERLLAVASLTHASEIATFACVKDNRRGSRAALYLLRDLFRTAKSPEEIRLMVTCLDRELGADVNRLALQYIYSYVKGVRNRVRKGGTMSADEKALLSEGAFLNPIIGLLDDRSTALSAEKTLVQIHEPAVQSLAVTGSSERAARAKAKAERAIRWRTARRPSSTWFSAYGETPVAVAAGETPAAKPISLARSGQTGVGAPARAAVGAMSSRAIPQSTSRRRLFSGGLGILSGDSTYRIGGSVQYADGSGTRMHFPLSELVFPLDVFMLTLRATIPLSDPWSVEFEFDKNLTTDAGSMEDSDWLSPGVLSIYSESDAELDAIILDARVVRGISRGGSLDLKLAGGIRFESFSFECRNAVQTSIIPGYSGTASGLGLTYDITYVMPYLEIHGEYPVSDRLKLAASLGYSPLVMVEDEDAHLARSPQKFSDGSYDGTATLFSLVANYRMDNGWFIVGRLESVTVEADGDQDARMGGSSWTIDAEIESEQMMATVAVGRIL